MSRSRRRVRALLLIALAVIVVAAIAYMARDRLFPGEMAGAADSTSVADTADTAAVGASDEDEDEEKKDDEPAPVPVEVATATEQEISAYYVTTATLEPEKKVDILAKVAGEVAAIVTEEGTLVGAGDLLCRLDEKEQRIALEEARINRDQQEREMQRLKGMYDQELVSEKDYADILYQYEIAQNRYESARLRFEWTRIRAPFAGVVTKRHVDEGEHVAIGSPLFEVADTEPLQLTMFLPEGEIGDIQVGQTIYLTPDIDPGTRFSGEIIRIAPEVDQRTGTIKVTAVSRGGGIPGSFLRVKIVTDTHPEALAVPRRSIVADAGDHFVFIAEADTVRKVAVETGFEDESFTEIVTGLSLGDSVVTAGVGAIRTGTKIKVLGREEDDEDAVAEAAQN